MPLPEVKLARASVELYPDQQVSEQVDAAEDVLDEARRAHQAETDKPGRTLASKALTEAKKKVDAAEKALEELKAAATGSVLVVVIDQMPKKAWREFQTTHPMRDGETVDQIYGVNWDELAGAYLAQMPPQVRWKESSEALEVSADEWPVWVETIGDPEYQKLGMAIGDLNSRKRIRPF